MDATDLIFIRIECENINNLLQLIQNNKSKDFPAQLEIATKV